MIPDNKDSNFTKGPSIQDVGIFDTPLHYGGISTLIGLIPTF